MAELRDVAARDGVPIARVAAERLSQTPRATEATTQPIRCQHSSTTTSLTIATRPGSSPSWATKGWRRRMWGSIAALYGRYPRQLAHLREGWWKDFSHVETLCALVVWRDWIDVAAEDPRHELAFQAQLTDFSQHSDKKAAALRRPGSQGQPRPSGPTRAGPTRPRAAPVLALRRGLSFACATLDTKDIFASDAFDCHGATANRHEPRSQKSDQRRLRKPGLLVGAVSTEIDTEEPAEA